MAESKSAALPLGYAPWRGRTILAPAARSNGSRRNRPSSPTVRSWPAPPIPCLTLCPWRPTSIAISRQMGEATRPHKAPSTRTRPALAFRRPRDRGDRDGRPPSIRACPSEPASSNGGHITIDHERLSWGHACVCCTSVHLAIDRGGLAEQSHSAKNQYFQRQMLPALTRRNGSALGRIGAALCASPPRAVLAEQSHPA